MSLRVYDSGTVTCTTASHTLNTSRITGKILKVQITASASSGFKLWIDASDDNTTAVVDEYIIGDATNYVTVNTTTTLYPAYELFNTNQATPATFDPDVYTEYVVDDVLEVSATAVANADTFNVVIWYDDMGGIANSQVRHA